MVRSSTSRRGGVQTTDLSSQEDAAPPVATHEALDEAHRLRAVADEAKSKAELAKLRVEVAQNSVVKALTLAAEAERDARDADAAASKAATHSVECMHKELSVETSKAPVQQPPAPEAPPAPPAS